MLSIYISWIIKTQTSVIMKDRYTKAEVREQAYNIFEKAKFCHIAFAVGNEPYIATVNYGFDDKYIYFHSSQKGKKVDMMETNQSVCYTLYYGGEIYSNKFACNWGTKFRSLIGRGKVELLINDKDKTTGLKAIMKKYSGSDNHEFNENVVSHTNIYRIKIEDVTTKQNKMYWDN